MSPRKSNSDRSMAESGITVNVQVASEDARSHIIKILQSESEYSHPGSILSPREHYIITDAPINLPWKISDVLIASHPIGASSTFKSENRDLLIVVVMGQANHYQQCKHISGSLSLLGI